FILLSGAFMKITKSSGKIASKILIAVYSLWIILCILRMLLYFLPVETFSEMLEYLRGGNGGTADVSE
ncbi:MAG: hypothetical protein LBG87_02750, partial [Spirochaetaceae bacterium]|nr:hypothetical protein [Spirochaetaceae bacterium]